MIDSYRQHHWLAVLIASCLLMATTLPRFGTVGHRHEAGRTPHVHLSYATSHKIHEHQDDRRHRQAAHALPFGGVYAHSGSPHEHPSSASGDAARPSEAVWTSADFHWHFDDGALSPGAAVTVVWESLPHALYLMP